MYDVIAVGARCAGSPLAMLLSRKGYRVLLVDRATFPSDTISGHFILHPGTVRLRQWGLLDAVLESNCPPIDTLSSNVGDFTLRGSVPWIDNAPPSIAPRRTALDTILVQAAAEAGAEVREGFSVSALLTDDNQVTGIRGQSQGGKPVMERARLVVGADGKHSRVAQLVQSPAYAEVPSLTCWYYGYWSDFPCTGLEINCVLAG